MAYHHYFPHTDEDVAAMLARCGMTSLDRLYDDIPEELLLGREYNLPAAKSERRCAIYSPLLEPRTTLSHVSRGQATMTITLWRPFRRFFRALSF